LTMGHDYEVAKQALYCLSHTSSPGYWFVKQYKSLRLGKRGSGHTKLQVVSSVFYHLC
jgi:hypothetical protein